MLYRRLGRTGLMVSELSYGAARGAIDARRDFVSTIHAAIDAGVNLIDTASLYEDGESERAIGEALQGHDGVIVETKYRPYDAWDASANYTGSPAELTSTAEQSLRNLRRDYIDILLGHGIRTPDSYVQFMEDGCYEAMVRLRDQGKVRYIGISELSEGDGTHEILKTAVPSERFDVVMLTINIMLQTAIETILPLCRQYDVGTVVMMALNQANPSRGFVSVAAALECVRVAVATGSLPAESPYTDPAILDFLQPYSVPEASLRYVLAQDISSCCVGVRTPARLHENLQAVDPPYLDAERLVRIEHLFGGIQTQVWG